MSSPGYSAEGSGKINMRQVLADNEHVFLNIRTKERTYSKDCVLLCCYQVNTDFVYHHALFLILSFFHFGYNLYYFDRNEKLETLNDISDFFDKNFEIQALSFNRAHQLLETASLHAEQFHILDTEAAFQRSMTSLCSIIILTWIRSRKIKFLAPYYMIVALYRRRLYK